MHPCAFSCKKAFLNNKTTQKKKKSLKLTLVQPCVKVLWPMTSAWMLKAVFMMLSQYCIYVRLGKPEQCNFTFNAQLFANIVAVDQAASGQAHLLNTMDQQHNTSQQ